MPDEASASGAPPEHNRPEIPIVETGRLLLRGHRLSDLDACVNMWADPRVTRFIGGTPSSAQQTWARLLGYLGHWSVLNFGYWAIEEQATGSFVGEIGFADFKRDLEPAIDGLPELGFALSPSAYGNGFATEAARAVIAWGDAHLPATKTVCLIDPQNVASLRVAGKCGYEVFASGRFGERPTLVLTRIASR